MVTTHQADGPTTSTVAVPQADPLVPAALRLAQLHEQGTLSEQAFETGLSNLFQTARDARPPVPTENHRVYLDWSRDPVKVGRDDQPQPIDALYARIDRLLEPYFAYGWEYGGGSARQAVHFEEQAVPGAEGETSGGVVITGAWVDLTR
jgi:hypothetical protein